MIQSEISIDYRYPLVKEKGINWVTVLICGAFKTFQVYRTSAVFTLTYMYLPV
jgi:hypothetical protein